MTERRNPFEGVTDFISEMARLRAVGLHGGAGEPQASERDHTNAWVPATDILARGQDLLIRVELAGVDPEDVDLSFSHGVLTVSGTRRADDGDGEAEFLVRERYYGEFRRLVTLPDGTTADQISAEFDDGLVEVTVSNGVTPADRTRIELADRSSGRTSRTLG